MQNFNNHVAGLTAKPLVAIEGYLPRYKGATSEQLGLLFEQCQALPTLKAVKKYPGLFNGYTHLLMRRKPCTN